VARQIDRSFSYRAWAIGALAGAFVGAALYWITPFMIFLHPETRQLFGYAEIEDEAQWAAIAQTEVCRRWWAHMRELMPSNADNSPVATGLDEVFHLD
jgi:L-rhamnose mutarotase